MKVVTLISLLKALPAEAEIRIGDQIEAGPYSNAEVGGIWLSAPVNGISERVILCANDDAPWIEEGGTEYSHVATGEVEGLCRVYRP